MRRTIIGGSACPPAMMRAFQETLRRAGAARLGHDRDEPAGHRVHASRPRTWRWAPSERLAMQAKQGRAVFGVDMKIVDEDGRGTAARRQGRRRAAGARAVDHRQLLQGRRRRPAGRRLVPDRRRRTIDADGFMQITDRSKDVIKSGGEWIGSIDLENIAMAHPAVAMAACIGAKHPKWDERPLLVVVKKPGADVDARGAARLLRGQDRQVVDARRRGLRRRDPARRHRQDAEEQAARAVPRPPAAHRLSGMAPRRRPSLGRSIGPVQAGSFPGAAGLRRGGGGRDLPGRALRRAGDAVRAAARHGDELPVGRRTLRAGHRVHARARCCASALRCSACASRWPRSPRWAGGRWRWSCCSVVLTIVVSMVVARAAGLPGPVRPAHRRRHGDLRRFGGAGACRPRCRPTRARSARRCSP